MIIVKVLIGLFVFQHLAQGEQEGEDTGGLRRRLADNGNEEQPIYDIPIDNKIDPLFSSLTNIPDNAFNEGMWSSPQRLPTIAIHTAVLPNGKVVTYGAGVEETVYDGRTFVFWDPSKGFTMDAMSVSPNAQDVTSLCSAGTLLSDGSLLTTGGGWARFGTSLESSILDYRTQTAKRVQNLNFPRWYGTMTRLPDGRALITGGSKVNAGRAYTNPAAFAGRVSPTPEIYTEGKGWETLDGATSIDAFGAPGNAFWYPRQWVTNVGTIFGISTNKLWELDLTGQGSTRIIRDFKTYPDTDLPENVGPTSTAVMYDEGKIIQVGGNGLNSGFDSVSSDKATLFDITGIGRGSVIETETSPMKFGRQWHNSAILPNGHVLVTGGSKRGNRGDTDAVYEAEIWDPSTGLWSIGAKAALIRLYHSTLALLPNGLVFSAGGGLPGPVNNYEAEIYYPPYLFSRKVNGKSVLASRPKIVSISSNGFKYGENISVELDTSRQISVVSLITLPATTHSFDSQTRRLKVSFELTDFGISIQIPTSKNRVPPGYYYLSVLDDKGVPSASVIVSIGDTAPDNSPFGVVSSDFKFLQDIKGAFEVTVIARFDSITDKSWQRIFDFGNGRSQNNILLAQCKSTSDICFYLYQSGTIHKLIARGAIVRDQVATWTIGINSDGLMWLEKNGVQLAQQQGVVPTSVDRTVKLLGESHWPQDSPLAGAILGIATTIDKEPTDGSLLNVPKQITGPFKIGVIARFDNISSKASQPVFDFGSGPAQDNIILTQCENTNNMCFYVYTGEIQFSVVAHRSIIEREVAVWRVGVDPDGTMWIIKDGKLLAESQGIVPRDVTRQLLVGQSNAGHAPLNGVVLGLHVQNNFHAETPLEEITGAVVVEASARFDNLANGNWQRVFDFSNGARQDNFLLSQKKNTNDIVFAIYQSGSSYQLVAPGAIVEGETAAWKVGVDPDGLMWIEKDNVRLVEKQGIVPASVERLQKLIGNSPWPSDTPLDGMVAGIAITNFGNARDSSLLNIVHEINGPFTVEVKARFDDINSQERKWQRIIDFGNGGQDSIIFGQCENNNDMCLVLYFDGDVYKLRAEGAIVKGEMASWRAGVNADRVMWIEKNGKRLSSQRGIIPRDVVRANKHIGESAYAWDSPLDGVVLGLTIQNTAGVLSLAEITGTGNVAIETAVRFDDISHGAQQHIFDFGNGPNQDNIVLAQCDTSNDICFSLYKNSQIYTVRAQGAIVEGQVAKWVVGVDNGGLMWINKNGNRLAEKQGASPANVVRNSNLLGDSNYGHVSLEGAIMGLAITNGGEQDKSLLNKVGQINGAFKIEVTARFDDVNGGLKKWQRVFDFSNGPKKDNVILAQCGTSNDLCLVLYKASTAYSLVAEGAISEGEMVNWLVGIDADGTMWIEKNGARLAEQQGVVPRAVQRNQNYIGRSAWQQDSPLDGVVLGLRVL